MTRPSVVFRRARPMLGRALIAATTLAAPGAACLAQSYPSKPIRMVVPFPPGGAADLVARTIAPRLGDALGQQVVIDNRAGANGVIGVDAVAKSAPDGYSLVLSTLGPLAINPHLQKMPYDSLKDLAPVTLLVMNPIILVAHPSVPARSIAELTALARSRPGRLTSGSSGNGSINHLAIEQYKLLAGIDITHVAYKGEAPSLTDVVGGQIDLMVASVLISHAYVKAGRLRGLAALAAKRSPALPDLPTMEEAGVKGYAADAWLGAMVAAGTPRDIVARLNGEITRVLQRPDVRESLVSRGSEPVGSTPEAFAAYIRDEFNRYGKVIRAAGVKLE
jgi:tripartite-type tricarboxylate transporter receptor subunit TctC